MKRIMTAERQVQVVATLKRAGKRGLDGSPKAGTHVFYSADTRLLISPK